MSKATFWGRVTLAVVLAGVVSGPAYAEPAIKNILNGLYPGASSIKLLGSNVNGNGGTVSINDAAFSNLFGNANNNNIKLTQDTSSQLWQVSGGGMIGEFDLQAKYAGNKTTFGFFNPPQSQQTTAPGAASFNAVITVDGSNGFDTNTNQITGGMTIHSNLIGGIVDNTQGPALSDVRYNGRGQDGLDDPTDPNNTPGNGGNVAGKRSITGSSFNQTTNSIFRVTNFGDPFAFGIRSNVGIGADVNIGSANQFSSVNSQNVNGTRQMLTFEVKKSALQGGGTVYVIAFEDLISGDFDYNDLVVELNPTPDGPSLVTTPEPVTLAMFGVGFLGLAGARLRKRRANAEVVA